MGAGLVHKARGKPSNRCASQDLRDYTLKLVRTQYRDFGPTFAIEALYEGTASRWAVRRCGRGCSKWVSGLCASSAGPCTSRVFDVSWTANWCKSMAASIAGSRPWRGLHLAGPYRRLNQQAHAASLRSKREHVFLLRSAARLSPAPWLPCRLLLRQALCIPHESRAAGGQGMTQFGRALAELNIEILCANSSQAKGRVERANRTLQDRLVKQLRLAGISSAEADNAFLPTFMERFNKRFAVRPSRPDDMHRKVNVPTSRLADVLCHREQRYVGAQLTFHYDRKLVILEPTNTSRALVGKHIELYDHPDRPMEVRSKGVSLPYRIFSKDQRVSHAAVVENKRLGHALSLVKAQQDRKREVKVLTNSEKDGYKKRPRQGIRHRLHRSKLLVRRGGNAGLMESMEDGRYSCPSHTLPTDRRVGEDPLR